MTEVSFSDYDLVVFVRSEFSQYFSIVMYCVRTYNWMCEPFVLLSTLHSLNRPLQQYIILYWSLWVNNKIHQKNWI